jgi:hypothetical protein
MGLWGLVISHAALPDKWISLSRVTTTNQADGEQTVLLDAFVVEKVRYNASHLSALFDARSSDYI